MNAKFAFGDEFEFEAVDQDPIFDVVAKVLVEHPFHGKQWGEVDKKAGLVLRNTTREGEHVAISEDDVDDEMMTELAGAVREIVAEHPGHYLEEPPEGMEIHPLDVQITDFAVRQHSIVRRGKPVDE